jgi:hypothetical protein
VKKQAALRKRVPISAVGSSSVHEREPDPHKIEGEVFAYISSEDLLFLTINDLPSEIQDVPISINLGLCDRPSYRFPVFLVSAATTSIEPDVASIEEEFAVLANNWHDETDFVSAPSRVTGNDNYLKIISMGKKVIPLILEDLKERGGNWYCALRILSGEDPVPIEVRGDVEQMKGTWLQWGRERGYIE